MTKDSGLAPSTEAGHRSRGARGHGGETAQASRRRAAPQQGGAAREGCAAVATMFLASSSLPVKGVRLKRGVGVSPPHGDKTAHVRRQRAGKTDPGPHRCIGRFERLVRKRGVPQHRHVGALTP